MTTAVRSPKAKREPSSLAWLRRPLLRLLLPQAASTSPAVRRKAGGLFSTTKE